MLNIKKTLWMPSLLSAVVIFGISTVLFMYISGYRLQNPQKKDIKFTQTGMINAKSIPEGASVYLDDVLVTATNDNIPSLEPKKYTLKIFKKGFEPWEKEVEVFPELVTDITAILVSQTPRLEPLTSTGANHPSISPTMDKIAYFSKEETEPGIHILPLSGVNISLFRSNPNMVIKDTFLTKYSEGSVITWSPDEKKLLVETDKRNHYLIDLATNTSESTASPELVKQTWEKETIANRKKFIENLEVPEELKAVAVDPLTIWAPDEKKFLYKDISNAKTTYKVYNMESPLPVDENRQTTVFTLAEGAKEPFISWYSDSYHLIIVDKASDSETGNIVLIRLDGTNKTELYNNTLLSNEVFSTPSGDKLIILTSFRSGDSTNLYTIGLR